MGSKPSLTMVCPRFYPLYAGGVEKFVHVLSQELSKRGFHIRVIASDPRVNGFVEDESNGVRVTLCKSYSPWETLHYSPGVASLLRRVDTEIIHVHGYRSLPMLEASMVKNEGSRLVVTTHLGFTKIGRWIYRLYNPVFGRKIFGAAEKIVIVSPAELREIGLLKHYREKVRYIPIGIRIPEYKADDGRFDGETLNLLYVGRLERSKGIWEMVSLMRRLDCRKYRLTIIGRGPLEAGLRRMVGKLALRNVSYEGPRSDEQLEEAYARSSVFLLPSRHEGHSVALTEAMAHGLVPIATDVGGNRHVVADSGYLVRHPVDYREVSRILEHLHSYREELRLMSERARERAVKLFSIQRVADMHERLYEEASRK